MWTVGQSQRLLERKTFLSSAPFSILSCSINSVCKDGKWMHKWGNKHLLMCHSSHSLQTKTLETFKNGPIGSKGASLNGLFVDSVCSSWFLPVCWKTVILREVLIMKLICIKMGWCCCCIKNSTSKRNSLPLSLFTVWKQWTWNKNKSKQLLLIIN